MKKINIAIVAACPFPAQRGTPVRIFRTAEALGRRGHNVHVVAYHFGDASSTDAFQIHRIPDIKSYRNFNPGPTYPKLLVLDPLLAIKLFQVLKTHQIDLIHAHHYEGLLVSLTVKSMTGHPVIYDAHTTLESELPSYPMSLPDTPKQVIGRFLDQWAPKQADRIIAVDDDIKNFLIRFSKVNPSGITVVPNGIEPRTFMKIQNVRKLSGDGIKRVIYTGNFGEFQGIDLLLKSFHEIVKQQDNVRLCMVSMFPFDRFDPMARELGIRHKIDFIQTGFDQVPGLLAKADVAVNPRVVCDGFPQKNFNYMAAGKPVVAFAGSAKLIEHGKTGWVVENGNVDEFAKGIIRLLQDRKLADRLGSNARQLVMTEFTWEKAAEKIEAVYQRVLNRW